MAMRQHAVVAALVAVAGGAPLCPACFNLQNAPHGNRTRPALRWLHVPKTGSTFQNTVFHWACPGLPADAGYGPGARAVNFARLYDAKKRLNATVCDRLIDATLPGHPPATEDALDRTVAMFRRPAQRLLSAHRDRRHADGFQDKDKAPNWRELDALGYARHPGIAGCATRMLLGAKCAHVHTHRSDHPRVQTAFARAMKADLPVARAKMAVRRLAFVGLQERWAESVCLFHAMLGGAPHKVEFAVAHTARRRGPFDQGRPLEPMVYDEGRLGGFVDAADEAVYAEAARVFAANLRAFAPACVT